MTKPGYVKPIYGVMAEFDNPSALVNAARAAREKGYRKLDAYSPFPIEELNDALHRSEERRVGKECRVRRVLFRSIRHPLRLGQRRPCGARKGLPEARRLLAFPHRRAERRPAQIGRAHV